MSEFWVLHNYGCCEGWRQVGDMRRMAEGYATILDAVDAREADIRNGGGEVIIVEVIPITEAYRRADYQEKEPSA